MNIFLVGISFAFFSFCLTWAFRNIALRYEIIDTPNHRSSHTKKTPRGGGAAILISAVLGHMLLYRVGIVSIEWLFGPLLACCLVGLIGFLDDVYSVSAKTRILVQLVSVIWGLLVIGGVPEFIIFGYSVSSSWIINIFGLFYLLWVLNLFNFMDGIDSIAGMEAISVCMCSIIIYMASDYDEKNVAFSGILLCGTAGFLLWNLPPAKIFMGDVGSGFVGLLIGFMSLEAAKISQELFWAWLILLGVFVTDATVTLLRRAWRGEHLAEAHRSHAYQNAARRFGGHLTVSLLVAVINIVWLMPIALGVSMRVLPTVLGVVVAYIPLVALALVFRAGAQEPH